MHRRQKTRKSVIVVTLFSLFLFVLTLVLSSISPLSALSTHANTFNSAGMWWSIGIALLFYLIPLALYIVGLNFVKIIMAIFCGIGLFTNLCLAVISGVIAAFSDHFNGYGIAIIIISLIAVMINIVWFICAFKLKNMQ
ncbi:hypothetical protein E4665_09850 [Sporolactobacillus shoreae]|uniref:Uncharacterized protein n=1 Tax=Sporolactobacillus shoreae TaxID=1465501 RepID=A0A4Z0GPS8_9BACL|nr:DUF5391 family protein [Sporolactobacillus shoreae]TGA97962.1 hypothetical protein E4665_09850 [Sporolactobacillus shoreae]